MNVLHYPVMPPEDLTAVLKKEGKHTYMRYFIHNDGWYCFETKFDYELWLAGR